MTSIGAHDDSAPRIVFLLWTRPGYAHRPNALSRSLGAEKAHIYQERLWGFRPPTAVRYLAQCIRTLSFLFSRRPDVVFVQTPPFVLTFCAWVYCAASRAVFITDNHSSTFHDRRWRFFARADAFFSRRALINFAHNFKNLDILVSWGAANPMVLLSPAQDREEIEASMEPVSPELAARTGERATNVLVVNRFAVDDCWREAIATAALMPEATFFITGDPAVAMPAAPTDLPSNVVLTGLLARGCFLDLMSRCDAVLALTSRKDTLLWSIREALGIGKPFAATDNEVIREQFGAYGVLTQNEPAALKAALEETLARREELVAAMPDYIARDKARWEADMTEIKRIMARERR